MHNRITLILMLTIACGGSSSARDASVDASTDANVDAAVDGGTDSGTSTDSSVDADGDAGTPVMMRIVATGDVFPHADLLGGQTARATVAGVRSLSLHRSMIDPDPLVLFDGADVEVGYVPGDDTLLTTIDASALTPGTYTFARLVQTYARYEVDATLHQLDGAHDGVVSSFQVIADGTTVDGTMYDAGHFDLAFDGDGVNATWTGEDGPFPTYSATAGAIGVVEDGAWAVYFPISLNITEAPTSASTVTLEVNMHESFRWTELLLLGYELGVFDVTEISFEPVIRFGGNSFELTTSF